MKTTSITIANDKVAAAEILLDEAGICFSTREREFNTSIRVNDENLEEAELIISQI